ncbi:MAG: hypothetical protein E6I02_07250 [Chloroflexi bacterium]|nr:MAG: hypothetical protein E6I02_07250 [Chloroflexota bacterium]
MTAESLARIDQQDRIEGRAEGDAIPRTKNVLKTKQDTHFYVLSDRLVFDNPVYVPILSIGDLVIGAGLLVTLGDLFLPRVQRSRRASAKPSRANL